MYLPLGAGPEVPKKRDSAYYRERLRRAHPQVYRDLVAGRYPSVRQAAAAAGLVRLPARLDALKREWRRASRSERRAFVDWVKAGTPAKRRPPKSIAYPDGRLRLDVARFLSNWLTSRKARPAQIMKEMGLSPLDTTLAFAISDNGSIRKEAIDKLRPWLAKAGFR